MKTPFFDRMARSAERFAKDEDGSATIWSLLWMLLFVGMAGLAIDSTNAWRVETMLTSTTDVAALAGAWELPEGYLEEAYNAADYATLKTEALSFATMNMDTAHHGSFGQTDDVLVGYWDFATRTFRPGEAFATPDQYPVNAVYVKFGRNDDNQNRMPTTMLRVAGLMGLPGMFFYDINTHATAVYGINECLVNGLIAREGFQLNPGSQVLKNVCMHGQFKVDMQPGIRWKYPHNLTTGETPADMVGIWDVRDGQLDWDGKPIDMSDPFRSNLYPPMVDYIPTIARRMLRGELHYRHFAYPEVTGDFPTITALPPNFRAIAGTTDPPSADSGMFDHAALGGIRVASLDGFAGLGGLLGLASTGTVVGGVTARYSEVVQTGDQHWAWPTDEPFINPAIDNITTTTAGVTTNSTQSLVERKIYFIEHCQSNTLRLTGTIQDVTIVTNCKVDIAGSAVLENVVLFTTSSGEQAVQISNGARLGAITACENWGGVRVYANGRIHAPSNGNSADSQFWGVQLVARTDIEFAAQSDSRKGLTMLAGGDIQIASQAKIGVLDLNGLPPSPAGGCPPDGVHKVFDKWSYEPVLVD